ncbi:TetR family transcriptional regulator [Caballeronia arvi]|uniref:TetR family transcriptional regulator n=1 Tax=Caballeronia arvi TaxID=1777135 RepID=A0A158KXR2_9BURK|nr:TetR family transcriptional regulator [Caballeronia arvi]
MTLVGLGYYIISNRFTIEAFTGRNYAEPSYQRSIAMMHLEMVLSYLRPGSSETNERSPDTEQ